MPQANAWMLDFGSGARAAVGGRELLHLIDAPQLHAVPYTPPCCNRVVFWQGHLLPVMDIACHLQGLGQEARFIGVVGFQRQEGEYPQFGALSLAAPPRQLMVSDEQSCDLPDNFSNISGFVSACFEHNGSAVPVLNLNRLFGILPAAG